MTSDRNQFNDQRRAILQRLGFGFFEQMYTIRVVEETLLDLVSKGLVGGTVHTCIGQETCAVGVVNALQRGLDVVVSNHRCHGHFLAYHDDPSGLIAELMGKITGVCKGIGGSQHLHAPNFYTNGIQGGMVPCAVGMALGEKLKGTSSIVVSFIGDGTMGQGSVYESLNIASLWEVPVLFVMEANQYAQTTPTHHQHAGDIARRAEPFDIPTTELEAKDVFDVYNVAQRLVGEVRAEGRPRFLVLQTYRLGPHSKGDDFRPQEERDYHWSLDPLRLMRAELVLLDRMRLEEMEEQVQVRIADAVRDAEGAPHSLLEALPGVLL